MADACECGNEPSGSVKCGFLTSCKPVSFSRRTLHHGVSKEVYKLGDVAACRRAACVLCAVQSETIERHVCCV